jgi:hypothetical protein
LKKNVYYGYKTRFLALNKEHRFRVFENRVLRRIFGPKTAGNNRKELHNKSVHKLYSSPNIIKNYQIKEDKMCGPCSTHGADEKYKVLVGKSELFKLSEHGLEDNIKMYLRGIEWEGVDWIQLAQV